MKRYLATIEIDDDMSDARGVKETLSEVLDELGAKIVSVKEQLVILKCPDCGCKATHREALTMCCGAAILRTIKQKEKLK